MSEIVILGGARTPIGRFGGGLRDSSAVRLGAHAIEAAVERSGIRPRDVDEVIVGHARQAGNGPNPGRLMAIGAGLPDSAHTVTIQQACVSSMKALILACQQIRLGESEIVVVAGAEHMSGVPYLARDVRWGRRMGDASLVDAMAQDGFRDPLTGAHMGELAEAWSERFGITREDQDGFALSSQRGAARAVEDGFAARMIAPVDDVVADEHPRPGTTRDALARLRPAFRKDGTVTAGNASGITDGAVALVVTTAERAAALGRTPLAAVRSWAVRAVTPGDYGLAVHPASEAALKRCGLTYADVDVFEINEAFAVQVLAACALMGVAPERVNRHGGAIALGHPVGMSGARIALQAAAELAAGEGRYALATICGNGGQAGSVVLRRVAA
jgi:acetyl-CoA C-acetyltransferase